MQIISKPSYSMKRSPFQMITLVSLGAMTNKNSKLPDEPSIMISMSLLVEVSRAILIFIPDVSFSNVISLLNSCGSIRQEYLWAFAKYSFNVFGEASCNWEILTGSGLLNGDIFISFCTSSKIATIVVSGFRMRLEFNPFLATFICKYCQRCFVTLDNSFSRHSGLA